MKRTLFLGMLMLVTPCLSYAQFEDTKYGEVSMDEMNLTHSAIDSSASAEILYKKGEMYFDHKMQLVYKHHVRLKIYNEAGYDYATKTFTFVDSDQGQHLQKVKGATFVLKDNKIKEYKLDKKDVFEKDINGDWIEVKFTMPNLEPGAIVEYKYVITSENPYLTPKWRLQHDIPVRYNEYDFESVNWFSYKPVYKGGRSMDDIQRRSEVRTVSTRMIHFRIPNTYGDMSVRTNGIKYIMRDIEPFIAEPYLTSEKDYRASIEYFLTSIQLPGQRLIPVHTTWQKTVKDLFSHKHIGKLLESTHRTQTLAKQLTDSLETSEQKIQAIYNWISSNITWNNETNYRADKDDIDDILKDAEGNSADMSLLLTQVLRDADIEAWPVMLSTRSHGMINTNVPVMSQLNNIVVETEFDNMTIYLDPKNRFRPYNLLAIGDLNRPGLKLIDSDTFEWVTVDSKTVSIRNLMVDAQLHNDGRLEAKADFNFQGYYDVRYRYLTEEDDLKEKVQGLFFDDVAGVTVDTVRFVSDVDNPSIPTAMRVEYSIDDYAIVAGDKMFVNPMVIDQLKSNPLKMEDRRYPISFPFLPNERMMIKLELPEGYELEESIQSRELKLYGNQGGYKRLAQLRDDGFVLMSVFQLGKTNFEVSEYKSMKKFFSEMVTLNSEQIVLTKKTDSKNPDVEITEPGSGEKEDE